MTDENAESNEIAEEAVRRLLHDEASSTGVPAPPVADLVRAGSKADRNRHALVTGVVAAVVLGAIGAGFALADRPSSPAAPSPIHPAPTSQDCPELVVDVPGDLTVRRVHVAADAGVPAAVGVIWSNGTSKRVLNVSAAPTNEEFGDGTSIGSTKRRVQGTDAEEIVNGDVRRILWKSPLATSCPYWGVVSSGLSEAELAAALESVREPDAPSAPAPSSSPTCLWPSGPVAKEGSGFVVEWSVTSGVPSPTWRLSAEQGADLIRLLQQANHRLESGPSDELGDFFVVADGSAVAALRDLDLPLHFWVGRQEPIAEFLRDTLPCVPSGTASAEDAPSTGAPRSSDLVSGSEGVGGLRLGMSAGEVADTGVATSFHGSVHDGWPKGCRIVEYRSDQLGDVPDDTINGLISEQQGLEFIAFTSLMSTQDGVRTGMSLTEVRRVLHRPDIQEGDLVTVPSSSRQSVYRIQIQGVVTSISLERKKLYCNR